MTVNIAMFSLSEQQDHLETKLEELRKTRDDLTSQIRSARKELDLFLKEHGNIKIQKDNEARWQAMQAELVERRKDPEWQQWRKDFLEKQRQGMGHNSANFTDAEKAKNPNAFFFIHKDMAEEDRELFFGPLDGDEEFVVFDDTWTMAHVLVHVGLFPSLSQARKNGGDGPIEPGFVDFVRGKKMKRKEITILNKF